MDNEITLVGALALAVTALAGVISFTARVVWVKLFDSDKGLLIIVIKRHLEYVDESAKNNQTISGAVIEIKDTLVRTSQALEKQEEVSEKIEEALEHHNEVTGAFIEKFSGRGEEYMTTATNEAIHHLARAGRAHLDGDDSKCRQELDQADKAVNHK